MSEVVLQGLRSHHQHTLSHPSTGAYVRDDDPYYVVRHSRVTFSRTYRQFSHVLRLRALNKSIDVHDRLQATEHLRVDATISELSNNDRRNYEIRQQLLLRSNTSAITNSTHNNGVKFTLICEDVLRPFEFAV